MNLILLMLLAVAPSPEGCGGESGVLFSKSGNWTYQSAVGARDLNTYDCIDPNLLRSTDGNGSVVILRADGSKLTLTCAGGTTRCERQTAGRVSLSDRIVQAIFGAPLERMASSRSSGWTDAVLGLLVSPGKPSVVDAADVFRGTPVRRIAAVRLCPADPSVACTSHATVIQWNGTSAQLVSTELAPGFYRIVEGNRTAEAWVRVVSQEDLESVKTVFNDVARQIDQTATAELPDAYASPIGRQLLRRAVLATISSTPRATP